MMDLEVGMRIIDDDGEENVIKGFEDNGDTAVFTCHPDHPERSFEWRCFREEMGGWRIISRPEETNRKAFGVKTRWILFPWKGAELACNVMEHGADKYGVDNWKGHISRDEYLSATMRHLKAAMQGEAIDPDSGLPHLAAVAANAMMILEECGQ